VKHLERLSQPAADRTAVLQDIGEFAAQMIAATSG
jgi:hypothetical protein